MSDEPENLVLVYLRRIDAKLDRVVEDLNDIKHRVTTLEGQVARMHSEFGNVYGALAGMQVRMDRFDARLERIERRLDIGALAP